MGMSNWPLFSSHLIFPSIPDSYYQPRGAGGTCSPPVYPKWPLQGPKIANGIWKGPNLKLLGAPNAQQGGAENCTPGGDGETHTKNEAHFLI